VTQSVELTLDDASDAAVRDLWSRLAAAGLPTEQRTTVSSSHRPHVTLFAGDAIAPEVDDALPEVFADLALTVRLGALLAFGPRRGVVVLTRQVVPSRELLDLQAEVAARCDADPAGHFGPGRWTPHVTLARRAPVARLSGMVQALGDLPEVAGTTRRCRRWDSDRRVTWQLTGG
jgi:2'-5' RNA ligase